MNILPDQLKDSALMQRLFRHRAQDTLPHTVTHQRIYIVPSKRGLAFLLTLLIMLIASVNYALALGYALCFLLTGLFSATLLHTYRNLSGIHVSDIQSQNTFAGKPALFKLRLSSPDARERHGISVKACWHDASHKHVLLSTPAGEQAEANLALPAPCRGICKLGRLTLQSDWPLGLWTCWSYLHVDSQALIYPQPEESAPALPNIACDNTSGQRGIGELGDVSGLRDYQPGDSIGSIAWKTLARGAGLKSRVFDSEEAAARTLLDMQAAVVPGIEAKLSRLCAWVLHAEDTHTDYAFNVESTYLSESRGQIQKAQALDALALYGIASSRTDSR